jgi:uncharacterized membrane protein (TIGR02234 family)
VSDRRPGGRPLAVAVLGGLACGGLAFAGANRAWAQVDVVEPGMPRAVVDTLGTAAVPEVGALALVVIAGSLALLPTGGRLRQVVALLVALASAGVVVGCLLAGTALSDAVVSEVSATAASNPQAVADDAQRSAWRWVTLAAGVAGTGLGAWAFVRAAGWPVMSSRYESPAAPWPTRASTDQPPAAATSAAPAAQGHPLRDDQDDLSETDLWRALDRGDDPT